MFRHLFAVSVVSKNYGVSKDYENQDIRATTKFCVNSQMEQQSYLYYSCGEIYSPRYWRGHFSFGVISNAIRFRPEVCFL